MSASMYGPSDSLTLNEFEKEPEIPKNLVLSPGDNIELSKDGLTAKKLTVKSTQTLVTSEFMTKGKHFASFTINNAIEPMEIMFGVIDPLVNNNAQTWLSHGTKGWAFYCHGGSVYHNKVSTNFSTAPKVGDEIGVSIDLDKNILEFYKNSEYLGTGFNDVQGPLKFAVSLYNENDSITFNPNKEEPKQVLIDSIGPFMEGKKFCLRSYWGTYISYGKNFAPLVVSQTNKDCIFTVELSKNRFTFKDSRNLKLTAEAEKNTFKVVQLQDPEVNGYTFQSITGKYLGVSSDMVLTIYNDSKSQNTRWFPEVPGEKLLGVGAFYKGAKLAIKTNQNTYLSYKNNEITLSNRLSSTCHFSVNQIDEKTFNLMDGFGNVVKFNNSSDITITEFENPHNDGFTFQFKDSNYLSTEGGKLNYVPSSISKETRFYPFFPKSAIGPFKDGTRLVLKTHLDKYFHYNQTLNPDVSKEILPENKFTVSQFEDKFVLIDDRGNPAVCSTSSDKLFTLVKNDSTDTVSYSLLYTSGKFLGVSKKGKTVLILKFSSCSYI
jgi:hypothetical protein